MKPFLAIFFPALVLVCYSGESVNAYSDRATLGARLIRALKTSTHAHNKASQAKGKEEVSGKEEDDTLSKDMEKQMKRIDALEDIFIGSSGSRGESGKVKAKANSARRSWVDDTQDLDKDLNKMNDDDENPLEKRSEDDSSYDGGDLDSPKGFGYEESTVEKATVRKRRDISDDKVHESSTKHPKKDSKSNTEGNDLSLQGKVTNSTGFSDKNDLVSTSKKSVNPKKAATSKENKDSDGDLMGATGAIDGDLESEEDEEENHGDETQAKVSDDKDSENKDSSENDNEEEDDKKYANDDDDKSEKDDDHDSNNDNDDRKVDYNDDDDDNNDGDRKADENDDDDEDEKDSEKKAERKSEIDAKSSENDDEKSSQGGELMKSDEDAKNAFAADEEEKPESDTKKWSDVDKKSENDVKLNHDDEKSQDDEDDSDDKPVETPDKNGHKKSPFDDSDLYFASGDDKSEEESKDDDEDNAADKKVSCRNVCSQPMDYETCAVPRCDYKVGTIKDLCQYLCHHQREHCEEMCE